MLIFAVVFPAKSLGGTGFAMLGGGWGYDQGIAINPACKVKTTPPMICTIIGG